MRYLESNKDRELRRWFKHDLTHAHLREIQIKTGDIRGLSSLNLPLEFPITAIAGKNGSGKSTILAIACCAYHNKKDGFKAPNRKQSYYTFADFFIQHKEEIPPSGIEILYRIAHDNWRKTPSSPDGKGIGYQLRVKKKGKWNEYGTRVKRNTVFVGIERIVPHSEKSQSKSYKRYFSSTGPKEWEIKVKEIVGYILNRKYDHFKLTSHSKYRLPIASSSGVVFSGFNMGAGENALFEIFSTIYSCPEGALFVIDEIELGLHIEAQKRFINKLKNVCLEQRCQIICTTHSKEVFECLPDEARIFIERVGGNTRATTGISAELAFAKLSAQNSSELLILVEDDVAKILVSTILPSEIRSRVRIENIGSSSALCVQLAAEFNRSKKNNILVVFDGDQKQKEKHNKKHTLKTSEKAEDGFEEWFAENISYLPGNSWPELWILDLNKKNISITSKLTQTEESNLTEIIDSGIAAGKHNEFHEIGKLLGLSREQAIFSFCTGIATLQTEETKDLLEKIIKKIK